MGTQYLLPDLESFKTLGYKLIKTYQKKVFLCFSVASWLLLIGINDLKGIEPLKHKVS